MHPLHARRLALSKRGPRAMPAAGHKSDTPILSLRQKTMKMRLLPAFAGLAICFALQIFAEEKESTPSASVPEATPTPTLGEHYTQVLPDRRVTFRLLGPKANAVKVMIGVKSGV